MGYVHDIGSQLTALHAYTLALTSAAAGITTASTASMGQVIDRLSYGDYNSMKSVVCLFSRITSTSAAGYATVGINIEHGDSSESTSMSAFTTQTTKVVGTTSNTAAANYYGFITQDVDLAGAKRYMRQIVTITKVATSSFDTIQAEGAFIFDGASITPTT